MEFIKTKENKLTRSFNIHEVNEIKRMYEDKHTQRQIASHFKTRGSNISYILKQLGFKKRYTSDYYSSSDLGNRKYNFNDQFFKFIDTESKAYWLGFIYADGSILTSTHKDGTKKGTSLEISLNSKDKYHLHNFNSDISGSFPVKDRKTVLRHNNKEYKSSRISISSVELCKDLIKHGCTPNKTLTLDFPSTVPNHLISHFIRGYIDGDGCVSFAVYPTRDQISFSVLGTKDFLEGMRYHLELNKITVTRIRKVPKKNIFELFVHSQKNIGRLHDYIYKDAEIFLGRKLDKFRAALDYYDIEYDSSPVSKLSFLLDDNHQNMKNYRTNYRSRVRKNKEEASKLFEYMNIQIPQKKLNITQEM